MNNFYAAGAKLIHDALTANGGSKFGPGIINRFVEGLNDSVTEKVMWVAVGCSRGAGLEPRFSSLIHCLGTDAASIEKIMPDKPSKKEEERAWQLEMMRLSSEATAKAFAQESKDMWHPPPQPETRRAPLQPRNDNPRIRRDPQGRKFDRRNQWLPPPQQQDRTRNDSRNPGNAASYFGTYREERKRDLSAYPHVECFQCCEFGQYADNPDCPSKKYRRPFPPTRNDQRRMNEERDRKAK